MKTTIALVLATTIFAGCDSSSAPTLAPNVTIAQQRKASELMGFSFPQETQFLFYHRRKEKQSLMPAPDDCVHLKIELPFDAATKMLSEAPFASAKWDALIPVESDAPDWKEWKPSSIKKYRSSQIELPNGRFLKVVVDEDRKEQTIVYLCWFET